MDAIIIIALIAAACIYYRRLDKGVYSVAIIDIFLRIFSYLIDNIKIEGITEHLNKYLPESIPSVISEYSDGMVVDVLTWVYVIVMGIFLFYIIKAFIKKK